MLRPVELLRGGMKLGDAVFSYVIAEMAAEEPSHAKQAILIELAFGLSLEVCRSIATLSNTPFDASSLATVAFQIAFHLM